LQHIQLDSSFASKERADLARLQKGLDYEREQARVAKAYADKAQELAGKNAWGNIDYKSVAKYFSVWHSEQTYLLEAIRYLTAEVLTKERAALEKAENNYRIFTNFSYGLYTLGFLVTLGGQLLGIKTPSSAE
jgi:hypothetical protein